MSTELLRRGRRLVARRAEDLEADARALWRAARSAAPDMKKQFGRMARTASNEAKALRALLARVR